MSTERGISAFPPVRDLIGLVNVDPLFLDKREQSFVAKIKEHGWFRTNVFGDDEGPGFSYTTGF